VSPKKAPPPPAPTGGFHSPFAGLAGLKPTLPEGSAAPLRRKERAPPPRAVVRLERKGRRGKEVTVVEQLQLSAAEREAWLKDMRRALGCGGALEEGALVLQGDHRQRVEAYLRGRGVARVSVG
jgi:translation initiation factor 1